MGRADRATTGSQMTPQEIPDQVLPPAVQGGERLVEQPQGIFLEREPGEQALMLAGLAADAGLDGVVCSAQEAAQMRKQFGEEFLLVTPGIRPASAAAGDQKRVMTPVDAIQAGSSYLVIGRPITQAADPSAVLATINKELGSL